MSSVNYVRQRVSYDMIKSFGIAFFITFGLFAAFFAGWVVKGFTQIDWNASTRTPMSQECEPIAKPQPTPKATTVKASPVKIVNPTAKVAAKAPVKTLDESLQEVGKGISNNGLYNIHPTSPRQILQGSPRDP